MEGSFQDIRSAAFDTLARPIAVEEVLRVIERALEHRALVEENRRLRSVVGESFVNSDDKVEVDGFELIATAAFNDSWQGRFSYDDTSSELNGDGIQLTGIPESELKLGGQRIVGISLCWIVGSVGLK